MLEEKSRGLRAQRMTEGVILGRQGKPLSIRWHLNKDLKEGREWVTWAPGETAFQVEGTASARVRGGSVIC